MARDINRRLQQLRARRNGADRLDRLSIDARNEIFAKSIIDESWLKRASDQPNTRYALGSMQEVDSDYTRISIETAERVSKQLKADLTAAGFSVDFRLQGSVPLNVHIRGVSDIDLLNLDTSIVTYSTHGSRNNRGFYTPSSNRNASLDSLISLRRDSEKILRNRYPAANVDASGAKAISISGSSLARPVDVVPSHWFDSVQYQDTGKEADRGITILNNKTYETIVNYPFLHIQNKSARYSESWRSQESNPPLQACKKRRRIGRKENSNPQFRYCWNIISR